MGNNNEGGLEIKDNRDLFKRHREETDKNSPVCRVCGCKEVHSYDYNRPTMDCIGYLRTLIRELQDKIRDYNWEKFPDEMGK